VIVVLVLHAFSNKPEIAAGELSRTLSSISETNMAVLKQWGFQLDSRFPKGSV